MTEPNNTEQTQAMDACLDEMCSWIHDSSHLQPNENNQALLTMLENWQPKTLFVDLPSSSDESLEKSSDRLMDNALLEFTNENDGSEICIAQYISTNTKKKDYTEIQRAAMHFEKGPNSMGREGLDKDVEELTKNQAKVMQKNFTLFKDGKPLRTGKIHMVNMGREKQGNSPMKFSLNYLSTIVPNVDGIDYNGNDKEKALPFANSESFRRTLERYRNKNNAKQPQPHPQHSQPNFDKIETVKSTPVYNAPVSQLHAPQYHIKIHDNELDKTPQPQELNDFDEKKHHHNYQAHKPIVARDAVDGPMRETPHHVEPHHNVQSFEDFETPIVHHNKPKPSGEGHKPNETFKVSNVNQVTRYPNGFIRAYRYHSKRRSASLYEWPAPSGSFRSIKAE